MLKDKGLLELIEAMKLLRSKYEGKIELFLAGSCGDANKTAITEEELKALLVDGYITWIGYQKDMYPVYVVRADGSKSYLRANVNKCRHFFNMKCGRSAAMAEHIIKCLDYEVAKRMREGSLSYMMTMWNWLTRSQWEAIEDEMKDNIQTPVNSYGTELI
jgi:hypothetical protein